MIFIFSSRWKELPPLPEADEWFENVRREFRERFVMLKYPPSRLQ